MGPEGKEGGGGGGGVAYPNRGDGPPCADQYSIDTSGSNQNRRHRCGTIGQSSPPWGVSNREPSNNDDRADIVVIGTEGVSINNLESLCSRIGLKSTEMLMHELPVGESALQGESKRLCSHKARGRVDNESVEDIFSPVYIPSMGSLEVGLNRREELEHRHIEVVSINVRIWRQEPVVERIRVKRITRGRTSGFELFSFVDIGISSIGNQAAAIMPMVVIPTFPGGHEVLRSSQTSGKISTIFEEKKADIPFVGRR